MNASSQAMKAVRLSEWGGASSLELVEIPKPVPMPGEVLVRVCAAGVNPVDVYTANGQAYNRVLELPFVPGWDVAGVVEAVGYGVTRFEVGDSVFGMPWFPREAGGYAEFVTAPARHFARMPGTDFVAAAALPLAGLTAWQMLHEVAGLKAGQTVLISGAAGGVGHLAVQIARSVGARVFGTSSEAKHPWLRTLGVDHPIDYTKGPVSMFATDLDVVIQMFGGKDCIDALDCLRPGGILVAGQAAWTPALHEEAAEREVRASGYLVDPDGAGLEALSDLVETGELKPHIREVFELAQAQEAHRLVATGTVSGKVVLKVATPG